MRPNYFLKSTNQSKNTKAFFATGIFCSLFMASAISCRQEESLPDDTETVQKKPSAENKQGSLGSRAEKKATPPATPIPIASATPISPKTEPEPKPSPTANNLHGTSSQPIQPDCIR